MRFTLLAFAFSLLMLAAGQLPAATDSLASGFVDHGVATPVSNHRGIVATIDGSGRDVVLVWLFDHRGGYALLLIDAETGKSEEFPVPFPPGEDAPYASILSSGNKFYTHFNSFFVEFDPVKRAFTFFHETKPQMAMGMTEDDNGVIWSVTYPNSGVVSFNPGTQRIQGLRPRVRAELAPVPAVRGRGRGRLDLFRSGQYGQPDHRLRSRYRPGETDARRERSQDGAVPISIAISTERSTASLFAAKMKRGMNSIEGAEG